MSAVRLSPEVESALADGRPVVALESTLIALGLPHRARREAAERIDRAVRGEGAVPATIAVIDGTLCAGLEASEVERLIEEPVRKASLRDLPVATVTGGLWATTVASTMAIAAKAGISFFATGGIGGVHRRVTETYDESADLIALARYPVLVVCAGPKAVLDLPRTTERLETLGVPVLGYRTDTLPAFYYPDSGIALDHRIDDPKALRAVFEATSGGGVLVVQAPPAAQAQAKDEVESAIERALEEAEKMGVSGSALTPFLLSALDVHSEGRFVETNVALVVENARLAARVAAA